MCNAAIRKQCPASTAFNHVGIHNANSDTGAPREPENLIACSHDGQLATNSILSQNPASESSFLKLNANTAPLSARKIVDKHCTSWF